MKISIKDDENCDVNMSPLIDCVFLLLIFFLVATMTKKINKDIPINLPSSVSAVQLRPSDNVIVIGVDAYSQVYFDGVPASLNYIHEALKQAALINPDARIRLDADGDVPVYKIIEVLDICQFRGLNNVGIRTYDESYNRQ